MRDVERGVAGVRGREQGAQRGAAIHDLERAFPRGHGLEGPKNGPTLRCGRAQIGMGCQV